MTWIEKLAVAAIVLLLALLVIVSKQNKNEFEEICSKAGGTTVWDGRQHQCIKP